MVMNIVDYSRMVDISVEDLLGRSRKMDVNLARESYQLYLWMNGCSMSYIADLFGRKRATISSNLRNIGNLISVRDSRAIRFSNPLRLDNVPIAEPLSAFNDIKLK